MKVREFRDSDLPALELMHAESGFSYQFPDLRGPRAECVLVVTDESDHPVMAAYAEQILQIGLLRSAMEPSAAVYGIRLLHQHMAVKLRAKGWEEANCFLPPPIAKQFGSRLRRTFGWIANTWPSFNIWFGIH